MNKNLPSQLMELQNSVEQEDMDFIQMKLNIRIMMKQFILTFLSQMLVIVVHQTIQIII